MPALRLPWASISHQLPHSLRNCRGRTWEQHYSGIWTDRCLHGCSNENLAPTVYGCVAPRIHKTRTVTEALTNETWLQDVRGGGALSCHGIREFFRLWDCLVDITLNDQDDNHVWTLDASGCYSSKSAYRGYFNGSVTFEPWHRLWKSWAPTKWKFFLWLAIHNRC